MRDGLFDQDDVLASMASKARIMDVAFDPTRSMRWRIWGDQGPPLVLLHGGHGSWLHWVRNIESLSARFTVCVADMPGFGDSDPILPSTPLDLYAQALSRSIDRLKTDLALASSHVHLAAFSLGGLIGAAVAELRDDIGRIALIGPAGHGGPVQRTFRLVDWRDAMTEEAMVFAQRTNLLTLMLANQAAADDFTVALHTRSVVRAHFRGFGLSLTNTLIKKLRDVRAPIHAVWGEHDVTAIPSEVAPMILDGRPERSFSVIAGGGHWIQYECADAFNTKMLDWFDPSVHSNALEDKSGNATALG